MWSSSGASFRILGKLPHRDVCPLLSLPLYLEYREVLTRAEQLPPGVTPERLLGFLRRFAALCDQRDIYFLWRPWLKDPDDDMVLELAVAGRATHIVTFNTGDFAGVKRRSESNL